MSQLVLKISAFLFKTSVDLFARVTYDIQLL